MRTPAEVERRIHDWLAAKAQFFPEPDYVAMFDAFVALFDELPARAFSERRSNRRYWRKLKRGGVDEKNSKQYLRDRLGDEIAWILGTNPHGALKKVVWDLLLAELHDAEGTLRWEGGDLVLEGEGCPPDFDPVHRGRSFSFCLRLKNGRFRDERTSTLPIEVVWVLYQTLEPGSYQFTAQDNTLSGILTLAGEDYEFTMSNHNVPRGRPASRSLGRLGR